ncbi:MAG: phosphatase PAP2 family protein [Chloroflexi bacterium]|nr:phosphatase PAP2 family protein [Chloroflexota bacterium]
MRSTLPVRERTLRAPRLLGPAALFAAAASLFVLLTLQISTIPEPGYDVFLMDWVRAHPASWARQFFVVFSFLTDNWPAMGIGIAAVAVLWLLGFARAAVALAVFGGVGAAAIFLTDWGIGVAVDRHKPLAEAYGYSFPSGHVLGTTVFYGFAVFLAAHYVSKRRVFIGVAATAALLIGLSGASRIYLQAHWPSDVAAGYLLGAAWLAVLIGVYYTVGRFRWVSRPKLEEDLSVLSCEHCRVARSLASMVLLDPVHGLATKAYRPPPVVKLLYWLSFQAAFPYERNTAALQMAAIRRRIAGLLTIHAFGKDLVARATAINCAHGRCSFVTEYVAGAPAAPDAAARQFLAQVSSVFAEAGLSIWQVNPRNPHAHTNLIRLSDGGYKIIDLESAVVSLIPARGQWRSAFRSGAIPIFDDIQFDRLRRYILENKSALEASLGPSGIAGLESAIAEAEQSTREWKDAEPRVWGRVARRIYVLLDWKAFFQHVKHALEGANRASEALLTRGLERWQAERRLTDQQLIALKTSLAAPEVAETLRHLGSHLVLSVVFRFPLGSGARLLWTLGFWVSGQLTRFRHDDGRSKARRAGRIHTPLVMLLALLPGFGAAAYLAAPPLRHKLLVRLLIDQAAYKLPLRLYRRLGLERWLAPRKLPA